MPLFSLQSVRQLQTCHPELQMLFGEVIKKFDCVILEGHRNEADQNAAFLRGNSKLKFPNGKHNKKPSMAVDCVPYPVDWKNTKRMLWFAGYVIGFADNLFREGKMKYLVRWGGDFNHNYDITDDKGLIDMPHFELVTP